MKDRVPLYPGRVTLTPVSGQANTFDLVRADQPTQEGTPLNKATLLKDATAALFGKTNAAVPDDILSLLSKSMMAHVTEKYTKTTIGAFAVGKTITLNVGGQAKEFIVVHQGKPSSLYDDSCNGTWLLMKDIYELHTWNGVRINKYESSNIHAYLNSTFLNLFDSNIKDDIKQVKIPYRKNGGASGTDQSGANGLPAKIFLLSCYEVGYTTSDNVNVSVDGAKLDYFTAGSSGESKRIANFNGSSASWWLRAPNTYDDQGVWIINTYGYLSRDVPNSMFGIRPALILPSTFAIYTDSSGNIYTEQEYETKITDVLGNLISIPAGQIKDGAKIATGSYTGTGTYGSSNPNSLTFDFDPKLVFISLKDQRPPVCAFAISGQTTFSKTNVDSSSQTNRCSFSGNSFTWYNEIDADVQFNISNRTYCYVAIG